MQRFVSRGSFIVASVFACVGVFFGQLVQSDLPIQISAERSVFQWEIQRLLLEGKAQQIPTIQQGNSVLKADTIVYEDQKKIGYAFGNVLFQDAQRGAVLRAGEGTYYTKTKEVVATKQPRLSLKKDGVTAVGEVIRFFPEKSILFFYQNVRIEGKNYVLRGDQAQLYQSSSKLLVQGNAVLEQDNTVIASRLMQLLYGGGKISSYTATDDVSITEKKEGYVITGGKLDYYQEAGYTRITKDPRIVFSNDNGLAEVTCLIIDMFEKENRANLLGNVAIVKGNQKVTARWGQYAIKEKRIILMGNPVLEDGGSRFEAMMIVFDVNRQELILEGKGRGRLQGR